MPACPKKHSPSNPLRLAFSASTATAALPGLSYTWACKAPAVGCPNLAAPGVTSGGTTGPNLVRLPHFCAPARILMDGS